MNNGKFVKAGISCLTIISCLVSMFLIFFFTFVVNSPPPFTDEIKIVLASMFLPQLLFVIALILLNILDVFLPVLFPVLKSYIPSLKLIADTLSKLKILEEDFENRDEDN